MAKLITLVTLVILGALASANTDYGIQPTNNYGYRYAVNDHYGNEHSSEQNRVGNTVKGQYKVLLPDGRLQTVTYIADEGGYRAKVDYTPASPGEATTAGLGVSGSAPAPVYAGGQDGSYSGRYSAGRSYESGYGGLGPVGGAYGGYGNFNNRQFGGSYGSYGGYRGFSQYGGLNSYSSLGGYGAGIGGYGAGIGGYGAGAGGYGAGAGGYGAGIGGYGAGIGGYGAGIGGYGAGAGGYGASAGGYGAGIGGYGYGQGAGFSSYGASGGSYGYGSGAGGYGYNGITGSNGYGAAGVIGYQYSSPLNNGYAYETPHSSVSSYSNTVPSY